MCSSADCCALLAMLRNLKGDALYSSVYIKQWMNRDELDNVKGLRQQCSQLNTDRGSILPGG